MRLAVPFFFFCSGFFFVNKMDFRATEHATNLRIRFRQYGIRLLKPLIVFSCVNILLQTVSFWREGFAYGQIAWEVIRSVLFYPFGALWYVQAVLVALCLLYPFLKRNRIGTAVMLGLPLYTFALLCNNYYFLICGTGMQPVVDTYLNLCVSARNGVFTGFLFLALGMLTARHYERLTARRFAVILSLLLSGAVYAVEIFAVHLAGAPADDGSLYLSHILFIPSLFVAISMIPCGIKSEHSILLRNLSTGIYYLHRPILFFVFLILPSGIACFALTVAIAIVVCLLVYRSNCKRLTELLR